MNLPIFRRIVDITFTRDSSAGESLTEYAYKPILDAFFFLPQARQVRFFLSFANITESHQYNNVTIAAALKSTVSGQALPNPFMQEEETYYYGEVPSIMLLEKQQQLAAGRYVFAVKWGLRNQSGSTTRIEEHVGSVYLEIE